MEAKKRFSSRPVAEDALEIDDAPDFAQAVPEEGNSKMPMEDYYARKVRWMKEHLEVDLEFLIDGTLSMTTVFVPVYLAIEQIVYEMERMKQENTSVHIKFGLSIGRDKVEHTVFEGGVPFTESADEFLDKVKDIKFTGGSSKGYENLDDYFAEAIRHVENHSPEGANRGVFVFSDSKPETDALTNLTYISGCPNRGLRFMVGYLGSYQYGGVFKIVDRDGDLAGDAKNDCAVFRCIDRLLQDDGTKEIKDLVRKLMIQTSVR